LTAALFGYFAITVVMKWCAKADFRFFSYYCWAVGALPCSIIISGFKRHFLFVSGFLYVSRNKKLKGEE
jgi:hypothetical protein